MKTNKVGLMLTLLLAFILLCSLFVTAEDIDVSDGDLGDADYSVYVSSMGSWDKVKLWASGLKAFTVIDGAVCSTNPDSGATYTASSSQLCTTNTNHDGMAFQLFYVKPDGSGWSFIGEKQLKRDERGCFTGLTVGQKYHWDFYYCDSTDERSCSDTDGGNVANVKGTVTFTLNGDSETWTDQCETSTKLLERYCIDDSVSSVLVTCDDQCVSGKCAFVSDDSGSGSSDDGSSGSSDDGSSGTSDTATATGGFSLSMLQIALLGIAGILLVFAVFFMKGGKK